jgi:hypothetical protein
MGLLAWCVAATLEALSAGCKPRVGRGCFSGQALCVDKKSGLFCGPDDTYEALKCGGAGGCWKAGVWVHCDQSVAAPDDECMGPGLACSRDRQSLLACEAGKFVSVATCKGPRACRAGQEAIACDSRLADPGDPCRAEGDRVCTRDGRTMLTCKGNVYASPLPCPGPRGCTGIASGPATTCDTGGGGT